MRTISRFLPALAAPALLLLASCSDDGTGPVSRTPLEVVATVPWAGASGVPAGITISVTFQREIVPAEIPAGAFLLEGVPLPVREVRGRTVALLLGPLQNNRQYTARLSRAAWKGTSGAPRADYEWRFSTEPGPPGETWSIVDAGTTADLHSISGNTDGLFAAGDGATLLASWMGTSWTPRTYQVPEADLTRVFRRRGGVDLLLDAAGRIFVSRNGVSWERWDPLVAEFIARTIDVGPAWAAGGEGPGSSGMLLGYDGHLLTTTATPEAVTDLIWTPMPAQFTAVSAGGSIFVSSDGAGWDEASVPEDAGALAAVAGRAALGPLGSRFVAAGTRVLTSEDGRAWTFSSFVPPSPIEDLIWTGSLFVAAGEDGLVASSGDGVRWTLHATPVNVDLHGVADVAGGSRWVVAGDAGTILVSPAVTPVVVPPPD